jgi:hypothetical protein
MLEVQAPRTFDLPCPWAPLQSIPAAASRLFPAGIRERWNCKQSHQALVTVCYVSGVGTGSRGSAIRISEVARRNSARQQSRNARDESVCAVSGGDRSRLPSLCPPTNGVTAREQCRTELHRSPSRSAGSDASSTSRERPKPHTRRRSYPVGRPQHAVAALEGSIGEEMSDSSRRSGSFAHRHPRDASHPRATQVVRRRKTRSGKRATSPMGFGSFRRLNPGDRCAGLPHRRHPLSEFLTPSAV